MTAALGVERSRHRKFLFRCPCGTNVITSKKTVACAGCGKVMEVHRVRERRRHRSAEPLLWPLVCSTPITSRPRHHLRGADYHQLFCSMARTHSGMWYPLESPDYNERCWRSALLFLLAPIWVPLLWMLLSPVFASVLPQQDRSHHYERHDIHVVDSRGGVHTVPTWKRVDD